MGDSICEALHTWCIEIFGGDVFVEAEKILSLNPSTGDYLNMWNIATKIYDNVCVPIGMGLVLIYFCANIIERALQQNFDLEHIVKLLLKLGFGLYFIEHGLEIMAAIYSMSFSFITDISNIGQKSFSLSNQYAESVWENLTGEKYTDCDWGNLEALGYFIGYGFSLLIPWLVIKVLKVVVNFVCYTRLIEFYIRTATAPIALSDFFTEGLHGNGWKFIKGYMAMALQSGIIMLAIVVFNTLGASILGSSVSSYWASVIKYLALAFATIGVMLKSLSLTKEIIGTN